MFSMCQSVVPSQFLKNADPIVRYYVSNSLNVTVRSDFF